MQSSPFMKNKEDKKEIIEITEIVLSSNENK